MWGSLWAVASVTMTLASGQTAARRTAAGGAYAGGQLFISVYDILSVHIVYSLFLFYILQGGHLCLREQ